MTIENFKVSCYETETVKLLDFFPELKAENFNFLLLAENDSRRKTFFKTFPLISESEMEIISVKKLGNSASFEFGIKGDVILFRDAMPTDSELKSLDV